MTAPDVIVIGGGLVGSAIARGLVHQGAKTLLLDEGDVAFRASRGNFGLVWVQGKGRGCPEYAQWSLRSADLWGDFAAELRDETGIDVGHERPGGMVLNLSEAESRANAELLAQLAREAGNKPYDYELLDHKAVAERVPGIGPDVVSGSYSPYDGHANPLFLLRAMHAGFEAQGGIYRPGESVERIERSGSETTVTTGKGAYTAPRVVIAAGLSTGPLARQVGINAPIVPLHGQILVTERTEPRLPMPTNLVRQTREGVMMLGFTVDDFGFDIRTRADRSRNVAASALRAFPYLRDLRVVRSWAALRIMTADGFPVYEASETHPGVFIAACHSGVTLAAVHARDISRWVLGHDMPASFRRFSTRRFDVPETV